jgi:hypothetical protein
LADKQTRETRTMKTMTVYKVWLKNGCKDIMKADKWNSLCKESWFRASVSTFIKSRMTIAAYNNFHGITD